VLQIVLDNIYKICTMAAILMEEKARMVIVAQNLILENVLYSPKFTGNRISICQLTKSVKCLAILAKTFVSQRTSPPTGILEQVT